MIIPDAVPPVVADAIRRLPVLGDVLIHYACMDTPLGGMLAVYSARGLCLLEFLDAYKLISELTDIVRRRFGRLVLQWDERFADLQQQLDAYFLGQRRVFSIPLDLVGTEFQLRAWQALLKIPYAETWSYVQQAEQLNLMHYARAVANANRLNKISILVPCHRVLRKNGEVGGYAGGVAHKRYLLDLERAYA